MKEKLSEKLETQDLEKVAGGQEREHRETKTAPYGPRPIPNSHREFVVKKLKCPECGYQEIRRHTIQDWDKYCTHYFKCPKCCLKEGTPNKYLEFEQD